MFKERKTTFCVDCIHCKLVTKSPAVPDAWYNYLCGASRLPEGEDLYDYCRNVNDGHCSLFQEKGGTQL